MPTSTGEDNDEDGEEGDVVEEEEEEEEEEEMQNENETGFLTGNISTIDGNGLNNNDFGKNNTIIDEITTVVGPTEVHTV